jgi:acyl carrier protein
MIMREQLLKLLKEIRPDVDFENEKKLIDNGVLDSFDIISTVQEMNDAFGVEIDVEDLEPANFNTIEAMMELIEKLQSEI